MPRRPAEPTAVDTGVGTAQVVPDRRRPRAFTLLIDGQVHGHVDLDDLGRLSLDYQARLALLATAVLPAGGSVLHLGGGAFAIPRALQVHDPALQQVVVERSAAIIRLAERQLGLRRDPALVVRKGDARAQVRRQAPGSLDLVIGDAFIGERTPDHLTTVESMAEVARVLRPGGAYVINIVDEQPWSRLALQAAAATSVFADVLAVGSRGVARLRDPGNVLLLAGTGPLDRTHLTSVLARGAHPCGIVAAGQLAGLVRGARARHDADGGGAGDAGVAGG